MESNWKGTKGKYSRHNNHIWVNAESDHAEYICEVDQDLPVKQIIAVSELIADAGNTVQQCDKLPSELLSERDDAVRIIREAIDLYENRGVDIPELWIDNAFLFIKQIEHGK